MVQGDPRIGTVSPSSVFIVEDFEELTHMPIPIDIPKEIQEEQAWRVITGRAERGITISHEGSDKGEIDQGGGHSGVSALDCAIGKELNEAFFKAIVRKER